LTYKPVISCSVETHGLVVIVLIFWILEAETDGFEQRRYASIPAYASTGLFPGMPICVPEFATSISSLMFFNLSATAFGHL